MPDLHATETPSHPNPNHLSAPPVTVVDRLRTIYRNPGPFTSVYIQTRPLLNDAGEDLERRWQSLRLDLDAQGASREILDAVEARLRLPRPEDTSAIGVIAAANASTIVDHALEPPRVDYARVDTLPYTSPLLEWEQRRIPHLVVTIDDSGADIVVFGVDHRTALFSTTLIGDADELANDVADQVAKIGARLIVVAGDPIRRRHLVDELVAVVPPRCRVVVDESRDVDDLADSTVRQVSDTAARATVELLREHRYLMSHGSAVEGTAATIETLSDGRCDVLLIHDDPGDDRRVWIGDDPRIMSVEPRQGLDRRARLVDAAIRSAVAQDAVIHVIPSTGSEGPEDDIAALIRST
jgi:hypothetical protein